MPASGMLHTQSTSIISESIRMSIDAIIFDHYAPNSKGRSGRRIGVAEGVLTRFELNNRVFDVLANAHNPVAVAKGLTILRYVGNKRSGNAHSRAAVGGDYQIQTHAAAFEDPIGTNAAVR